MRLVVADVVVESGRTGRRLGAFFQQKWNAFSATSLPANGKQLSYNRGQPKRNAITKCIRIICFLRYINDHFCSQFQSFVTVCRTVFVTSAINYSIYRERIFDEKEKKTYISRNPPDLVFSRSENYTLTRIGNEGTELGGKKL